MADLVRERVCLREVAGRAEPAVRARGRSPGRCTTCPSAGTVEGTGRGRGDPAPRVDPIGEQDDVGVPVCPPGGTEDRPTRTSPGCRRPPRPCVSALCAPHDRIRLAGGRLVRASELEAARGMSMSCHRRRTRSRSRDDEHAPTPMPPPTGPRIAPKPRPPEPGSTNACPRRSITPPRRRRSLLHFIAAPPSRYDRWSIDPRGSSRVPPLALPHAGGHDRLTAARRRVQPARTRAMHDETGPRTGRDGGLATVPSIAAKIDQPPLGHGDRLDPRLHPRGPAAGSNRATQDRAETPRRPGHARSSAGAPPSWVAGSPAPSSVDGRGRVARLDRRGRPPVLLVRAGARGRRHEA